LETADLFEAAAALGAAGVEPVTVSRPDYVFESRSAVLDKLRGRLGR
jgi:ATP phosphoribosyltransferase